MVALPSLGEDEKIIDADGPRLRLLICHDCKTIEPLPWFDGPVQYDDTLNYRLASHRTGSGEPHHGTLGTVSESSWEDPQKQRQIMKEITKAHAGGETGLGHALYNARSTFQEDALTCWRQHNRTTNCQDYKSDSKRLVPDTRGERRELGLSVKSSARPATSLCNFCPYHSVVMQRARKEQGFY
jgi:hypothetical protein